MTEQLTSFRGWRYFKDIWAGYWRILCVVLRSTFYVWVIDLLGLSSNHIAFWNFVYIILYMCILLHICICIHILHTYLLATISFSRRSSQPRHLTCVSCIDSLYHQRHLRWAMESIVSLQNSYIIERTPMWLY